jgi:murein DD-endopeptidase MepM/ murein hydrolase activator NlpD
VGIEGSSSINFNSVEVMQDIQTNQEVWDSSSETSDFEVDTSNTFTLYNDNSVSDTYSSVPDQDVTQSTLGFEFDPPTLASNTQAYLLPSTGISNNPKVSDGSGTNANSTAQDVNTTHTVQTGETFSSIAQQAEVSVEDLQKANPQIQDINLVRPDEVINLPQRNQQVQPQQPSNTPLSFSDTGAEVEKLQEDLVSLGYLTQEDVNTGIGIFGPKTETAVKQLQSDFQIEQDGVVGSDTTKALQSAKLEDRFPRELDLTQWPVPDSTTINLADKPGEGDGQFGTPRSNASGRHSGLDIQGEVGDRINAFRSGEVLYSGPAGTLGNLIVIDHGIGNASDDVHSAYAHLNNVLVEQGDTVDTGMQIGTMGRTGNTPSTGDTHLHFEVREDAGENAFTSRGYVAGTAVDPLDYVQP